MRGVGEHAKGGEQVTILLKQKVKDMGGWVEETEYHGLILMELKTELD